MSRLELKVPPVAVFLACGAAALGLRKLAPGLGVSLPWLPAVAVSLACVGLAVGVLGIAHFVWAGTTVHPTHPSRASRVVANGLYAITRNPMYLGLACLLAGFALWLSHPLALLSVPAFVLYMNRFQIEPEERALLAKFGENYAAYRKCVRRWI